MLFSSLGEGLLDICEAFCCGAAYSVLGYGVACSVLGCGAALGYGVA